LLYINELKSVIAGTNTTNQHDNQALREEIRDKGFIFYSDNVNDKSEFLAQNTAGEE